MEKVIICSIVALISLVLAAGSGLDKSSTLDSVIARLAFNDRTTRSKTLESSPDKQRDGENMNARLEAVERQLLAFKSTPLERRTPCTCKIKPMHIVLLVFVVLTSLSSVSTLISQMKMSDSKMDLDIRIYCDNALAAGSDLNISNRLEAVTARLVAMERQIVTFNSTLQDKSGQTNRISRIHVSFEVTSSMPKVSLSGNQFFKFDTVTLNIGGGYHAPTGIFEAPVNGTYLFWASILPYEENHVHVMLYKEGRRLALAVSLSRTSASLSYIIQVKRGEKVWFQTAYQTTVFGHSHSSYGGTLIHQN